MDCPICGRRNRKRAQFCIQCGRPLPRQTPGGTTRRQRSGSALAIGLVGAIAVLLVLLFFALLALLLTGGNGGDTAAGGDSATATLRGKPSPEPVVVVVESSPGTAPPSQATAGVTPAQPSATVRAATSIVAAPTVTPQASATPEATAARKEPAPACRRAARGLIAFSRQKRCNSETGDGCGPVETWIMDADGSGQARMCGSQAYEWGLIRDRTSPDGAWRMEVTGHRPDIYCLWLNTGQKEMIIVNNRKDWDPVLSADGWWLAWVTNRNANDEIYIKTMDHKDQNQRRLTENDWEWDKHPTWSPDGRSIAFYSNRAGSLSGATRQIWVMDVVNDRGANLRNLSRRPDMVDTDPVWYKWDSIPN